MVDQTGTAISGEEAGRALAFLEQLSPDLRGAAIIGADGEALAAPELADRWAFDAANLLEVADAAGEGPVEQVHIATEQGEVFVLRHAGLTAVAVTERFALASVLFFDMRSILRDLAAGRPVEGER